MAASEAVSTMRSGWGCPSVTLSGLNAQRHQPQATLHEYGGPCVQPGRSGLWKLNDMHRRPVGI